MAGGDDSPLSSYPDYPAIEPTTFDLIVCGTGLLESILAAAASAASAASKSVLHLDRNPFYGSHFSSLSLPSFSSFLHSAPPDHSSSDAVQLRHRRFYSDVQTSGAHPEDFKGFLLDLSGPRVLYCADAMVDLIIRSRVSHHVEFKSVDASLIYWDGKLHSVPDSRQAIFTDESLQLAEKRQMMKFLKLVQQHVGSEGGDGPAEEDRPAGISAEDLEIPFADFLRKQKLPPKIGPIILYAIALADYDQDDAASSKKLIMTKEGTRSLELCIRSVGRFPNAVGAFIYPIHGHGELPQAFCRCAAVKGALYALRMPVLDLLIDKETGKYNGIRLASGQDIFSSHLVLDPSFHISSSLSLSKVGCEGLNSSDLTRKVARGVCITSSSILQTTTTTKPSKVQNSSNFLVIFPPKSLHSEQLASIRALQLSSDMAVCPPGVFLVYLSTPCDDAILGKKYINTAMNVLFLVTNESGSEGSLSTDDEGSKGENKPALLWSTVYVQELKQASVDVVCSCPMPDENLDYRSILETTKEIFTNIYPGEEFFPETPASDNAKDDDGGSSSE